MKNCLLYSEKQTRKFTKENLENQVSTKNEQLIILEQLKQSGQFSGLENWSNEQSNQKFKKFSVVFSVQFWSYQTYACQMAKSFSKRPQKWIFWQKDDIWKLSSCTFCAENTDWHLFLAETNKLLEPRHLNSRNVTKFVPAGFLLQVLQRML